MEQCNVPATLPFDAFIDIFFILDIILTFNMGIVRNNSEYIDDRVAVAKAYLKSSFLFDAMTSFPVASRAGDPTLKRSVVADVKPLL